jgi:hypothetical protein
MSPAKLALTGVIFQIGRETIAAQDPPEHGSQQANSVVTMNLRLRKQSKLSSQRSGCKALISQMHEVLMSHR